MCNEQKSRLSNFQLCSSLILTEYELFFVFEQISIEEAHQQPQPQTEPKSQYTDLDVSPQNYYSIPSENYQPAGSGFAYLTTASNKDYSIYQNPNTVLYKG